jgi:hypothetical protein
MALTTAQKTSLALLCSVQLFSTFTVSSIVFDPELSRVPRDLDVVELWAGVRSVELAALAEGLQAESFDILQGQGYDITTQAGFAKALSLVMRLKPRGLLAMAPVCSSFVFASTSVSCRKKSNFSGNALVPRVETGNVMANIAMLLLCVAVQRELSAFIENPAGSYIFSYLGMNLSRLTWLTPGIGDRCDYVEKKLKKKETWKKTFKFVCTDNWIIAAMRKCKCGQSFRHEPLMDTDDLGKTTGRKKEMQQSSSYPPALGVAIIKAWSSWRCTLLMPAQLSSTPAKKQMRAPAQLSSTPAKSRGPAMGKAGKRKTDDDFVVDDGFAKVTRQRLMPTINHDFWQEDCQDNDFFV